MGRPGPSDGSAAPPVRAAKAAREGRTFAFTQADVSRALRGAAAAGHEPKEFRITRGEIRVLLSGSGQESKPEEYGPDFFERELGHGQK